MKERNQDNFYTAALLLILANQTKGDVIGGLFALGSCIFWGRFIFNLVVSWRHG